MKPHDSEDGPLRDRISALESEVRELRNRIARLESSENTAAIEQGGRDPVAREPQKSSKPQAATAPSRPQPPPLPTAIPPLPAVGGTLAYPTITVVGRDRERSEPLKPPEPSSWVRLLQLMHLLPPSGAGSGEVTLGSWWATRLGALFVVLAGVSFGVYLSMNTPPWVRLAELAGVSLAIAFAGGWLDRRIPKFGAVILGSGLALIFFCAFAAYAIPAVKVTDSALVAGALQLGAVVLIYGVGVRRGSATVATMATVLGFVSAFFSIKEGFDDVAVFAALALAVVSVLLRRWRKWGAPLLTAVPLTYAVVVAVSRFVWSTELGGRPPVVMFGVVVFAYLAFFISAVIEVGPVPGRVARAQRWAQTLNGSLGSLSGLVVAVTALSPGDFSSYFFCAGLVLLGSTMWLWRIVPLDPLVSSFGIKASAWITLGVLTEWETRTRWVALLIQSFVMLAAAQRTRKLAFVAASVVVWCASLYFFSNDIAGLSGLLGSPTGIVVACYIVGSPVLLTWVTRQTEKRHGVFSSGSVVLLGAIAAIPAWLASRVVFGEAWSPTAMVVVAMLCVFAARLFRSMLPLLAACTLFLWSHAALQTFDVGVLGSAWLWTGALVLAGFSAFGAWWAIEYRPHLAPEARATPAWSVFGACLGTLALTALMAAMFTAWPTERALGVSAIAFAGLACYGARVHLWAWIGAGVLSAYAALLEYSVHEHASPDRESRAGWLWLAAILGVILASATKPRSGEQEYNPRWETAVSWLAALAATLLFWLAAVTDLDLVERSWMALIAATAFVIVARTFRIPSSLGAATLILLEPMYHIAITRLWAGPGADWSALLGAWAVGMGFVLLPPLASRLCAWIPRQTKQAWRAIHAVLGCLFIVNTALQRPAVWESLTTVIWAVTGVAVFLAGLLLRARSHRVAGLAVLAICVPRVFVVDIQSTLYRIAAFVALGVVLLVVGLSYQKLRHLVEEDSDTGNDSGNSQGQGSAGTTQ